eukprot:GHVU01195539.1.p1 GENE.GHVU01195539.1~~GHVU01195539.1.p1  ORF type:complete len:190 (-),score=17.11 GHVU01195539.1:113-682(-)
MALMPAKSAKKVVGFVLALACFVVLGAAVRITFDLERLQQNVAPTAQADNSEFQRLVGTGKESSNSKECSVESRDLNRLKTIIPASNPIGMSNSERICESPKSTFQPAPEALPPPANAFLASPGITCNHPAYRVDSAVHVTETDTDVFTLTHISSKAKVMYIRGRNEDSLRRFLAALVTSEENDKGKYD